MQKSLVKALGLVIGLVLSGFSYAISMGDINVINTLGEPMNVLIELGTASKDEISTLSARLARPEVFKDAGLDYPSGLPPLKFKIETNANGEPYIKITSVQPINEPFVNLLVELVWSSGKLLREYTFLLDPPGYVPAQPKPAEVKPVEPNVVDVSELESKGKAGKTESPVPAVAPGTTPAADETKVVSTELPAAAGKHAVAKPADNQSAAEQAHDSHVVSDEIKVKRGDSLSKIALQIKPSDVSLERALVALYHANADAFDGKNMNRLKVGKILHMPEQSELDKLTQAKAVAEIRAQADDWHAYRQKLAAASGHVATGGESRHESSGKISTTVADHTPAVKESAKEVVRLSKGEAPGDKTSSSGNAKALQNKIHALEEESIAKSKALQESNERVIALEKNIQDLRRLIDLKGQPPVGQVKPAHNPVVQSPVDSHAATKLEAQSGVVSTPVASQMAAVTSGVAATASEVVAASAVSPVKPVKPIKPIMKPKVVTQPSLLDEMLGNPTYMAGAAAVLLGLLGLVYSRRGKGKKGKAKFDDKPIEHTMGGSGDLGFMSAASSSAAADDLTNTGVGGAGEAHADDFDPISGAELFLSFGRDEQAEKILQEALIKTPDNHQIHLKLLSIYADRQDTQSFATIAGQLRDSGDTDAWEQAVAMGKKLDPSNPMYGGSGSAAAAGSLAADHAMDDVLNVGKAANLPPTLDFDFDQAFGTPETSAGGAGQSTSAAQSSMVDFDVTASPADTGNASLDFDVTASHMKLDAPSAGKVEAVSPASISETMDFSLDFPSLDTNAGKVDVPPVKAASGATFDFDVTASHMKLDLPSAGKVEAVSPASISETMDFSLDFPSVDATASKVDVPPVIAAPEEIKNIGLDEINLNLDMDKPAAPLLSTEEKDAHWHDVASKLDLAKAYQEMGDVAGAREILEEVLREGGEQHRMAAEAMLQQLPA